MKLGIIVYSKDPETVWNAFRFANTARIYDDDVAVFLLGAGVESASLSSIRFNVAEQMSLFREEGGEIIGCGVCCEVREDEMPFIREDLNCAIGSMQDLYRVVKECDKVLTF